jgi:hypothetical protein
MTLSTRFRFESLDEKKKLERQAKRANLSLANYLRARLDLTPLAHGGARANGGRRRSANQTSVDKGGTT